MIKNTKNFSHPKANELVRYNCYDRRYNGEYEICEQYLMTLSLVSANASATTYVLCYSNQIRIQSQVPNTENIVISNPISLGKPALAL